LVTLTAGLVASVVPAMPAAASPPECAWSMTSLPVPTGSTTARSSVSSAASGGWVVGSGDTGNGLRWHNGQVEDLGRAFGEQTELRDINASGVAVGQTFGDAYINNTVVYRGGGYERLPVPAGMRGVKAKAINDAGDIVGTANDEFTNVNVAFWPAASPGTVVVINPDPAQYY
jgi:hypothetical protein